MPPVLRYAGFGSEAVYGTAVAAGFHVDIQSATLDAPSGVENYYAGGIGRGVRTRRPGYYMPAGNIVYAWDIRTIGAMLRWALGGYVHTAAAVIALANPSAAADDIIDTAAPHGFSAGDRIRFSALTGGAGLSTGVDYYVIAANLAASTFQVSLTPGGAAALFTTDITAGNVAAYPGNTHEAYASNDVILPSFTSRIGKDVFEHVFAGCVVDSLELDLAGDFLLATMTINAKVDSKAALTAESALLLPDEFPLAFHEATMSLFGNARSADVKTLKLNIANGARPESGRGIGSRYAYRNPVGSRDITLAADLWYEDTDDLEDFWGGPTGPSDDGPADQAITINCDAGSDGALMLSLPRAHFTKVATQPSGREEITASTEIRAMVDDVTLADAVTEVRTELLATVQSNLEDLVP